MFVLGVPNFSFYHIELTHPRIYLKKKKWALAKTTLLLVLFPLVVVLMVIYCAALPY